MSDIELPREHFASPRAGDHVRICLVSTKTDRATRMQRGLADDIIIGTAVNTLKEGERFYVRIKPEETFQSSTVKYIGAGIFNTENSTYSYEVIP